MIKLFSSGAANELFTYAYSVTSIKNGFGKRRQKMDTGIAELLE